MAFAQRFWIFADRAWRGFIVHEWTYGALSCWCGASPRAPPAISSDAATRMAITSVAVTNAVGDLIILRSRCGSSHEQACAEPNGFKKMHRSER
jgi:hypothetical protein